MSGRPTLSSQRRAGPAPVLPATPATPPSPAAARIGSRIFCASLQDRPEWAAVVPLLLAGRAEPRWEKARLSSHDLAVHIAPPPPGHPPRSGHDVFRFLLVAPADVGLPETDKRLQRLAQRKTGLGGAVLFLLARASGRAAYSRLQEQLQTLQQQQQPLSLLPVTAVEALPATVAAFCSQPTVAPRPRPSLLPLYLGLFLEGEAPLPADAVERLLAAAAEATRLGAAATLVDVASFFADLLTHDRRRLQAILGPDAAVRLVCQPPADDEASQLLSAHEDG